MAQFPVLLSTGAVARYPLTRTPRFATLAVEFADLSQQTASLIAESKGQWQIDLTRLLDKELADVQAFWESQKGAATAFTFLDPWDNLLTRSEEFEHADWTRTGLTAAANAEPDPFGLASNRVRLITVNATGDSLTQTLPVVVAGEGLSRTKGLEFTASAWFKQNTGVASLSLTFDDAVVTDSFTKAVSLTGSLVRHEITGRFAVTNTATNLRYRIHGFNATGSFFLFGAQLELEGIASGYKRTTVKGGVRQNCRFGSDEFPHVAEGFDQSTAQLVVREG